MRVRVYWSLARLAEMDGRSKVALGHARRAIALLQATEDKLQQARAHLLAAWIMNSARDPAGAGEQLRQAERLLPDNADADDRAILCVEQARTHALLGDGENAAKFAAEAIALGDERSPIAGTAHWALAQALALQGETGAADDAFTRAIELLEANHRWREAAEACRDWGRFLRDNGRHEQALIVLDRGAEFALRLSSPRAQPSRTAS